MCRGFFSIITHEHREKDLMQHFQENETILYTNSKVYVRWDTFHHYLQKYEKTKLIYLSLATWGCVNVSYDSFREDFDLITLFGNVKDNGGISYVPLSTYTISMDLITVYTIGYQTLENQNMNPLS